MSDSSTLVERFIIQELDDNIRSVLKYALDERANSKCVLLREFEFNCFDVIFNFEKNIVTLQDVLSSGEDSTFDMHVPDFISACGLSSSCSS